MDPTNQAPESLRLEKTGSTFGASRALRGTCRLAAWPTLLAGAGLAVTAWLIHVLFATHPNWVNETLPAAAAIAAICGYFVMRKQERLLALLAEAESQAKFEDTLLHTVADNIPDNIFTKDIQGRYIF